MKYAIVGLGFIYPRHKQSIEKTGGEILMGCDTDPSKHVKDFPCTTHFQFLTAIPRWNEVDTVVVCTPNDTHIPISHWASKHGKKVICEKPLAISSDELHSALEERHLYPVMQLRFHPVMEAIKKQDIKSLELYVSVKRDASYWQGWKGNEEKSGGILFNLGVHYFDVLLQLLGNEYEVIESSVSQKKASGVVKFARLEEPVRWSVEITEDGAGQDRYVKVNGFLFRFSDKDNLSFEDLHTNVYEEALKGRGTSLAEMMKLTRFIENLKTWKPNTSSASAAS